MHGRFLAWKWVVAFLVCGLTSSSAQAQTYLWNGGTGAGPHSWNTNGNWSLAGFPNASGVTASLLADWSAAPTINLNQAITVGRLFIDDTGGSGDVGVSISPNGGSLTFNNGASNAELQTFGDASLNFINSNVTLTSNLNATIASNLAITGQISGGGALNKLGSGTLVFTNNNTYSGGTTVSAGMLQLGGGGTNGSISGDVSVASGATLGVNRSNTLTFSGAISGAGGLLQDGAGTLVLTGANTYAGTTVVSQGTLALGSGGSLASAAVTVNTGAVLRFSLSGDYTYGGAISGGGASQKTTHGELTLTGTSTFSGGVVIDTGGLTLGDGGANGSIACDVQNNANLNFNRSDVSIYAGAISGGGNMFKMGAGTLILTGTSSYTGNTNVNAGVLQIGNGGTAGSIASPTINNNAALTFNRSDSITYSGAISGAGSLTQSGTGTLIFTGTNTYSGGTTISAGTLQIGSGGTTGSIAGDVLNNSALAFNRSDSITFSGVISGSGSLTKQGGGTLILTGANTYAGGTTVSGGTLQIGAGGATGAIVGNIANNSGVTFNRSDDLTFSGTISGSGSLLKNGAGKLTLTADNSFAGGTLILAGTLQLGNGGATGSIAGDIGNFGALIFNRTGSMDYSGVISQNGTLTQQAGTLRLGGANTYTGLTTISSGVLTIGTGGATGSIAGNVLNNSTLIFNRTADYSYGGNISGSGSIFKVNTNTLTLTGTNTYAGTTHIEGGTLVFSSGASLGSGGTIRISGGTLRWGAGNTTDLSARTFFIDAGGATLDTNVNNITFASAIGNGGTGALTKVGTGTLILAGNNSYTGGTTISAGTLQIGGGGTTGSVSGNILNNSGLTFNRSDHFTYAGVISGTGTLVKDGSGTLTFTADHLFTNTTLVANGALRLGDGGVSGSLVGDIVNLSALIFDRSGTLDYGGVISGNGTVTKQGTGVVRLTGANDFTGLTTISGGALAIGNGGATGAIVSNVHNNSTLIFNRTTDYTYAGNIGGSGSVFKVNSNTLTLTGTNSYAGTTHIEGGVLEFSSLANLGSGGTIRFGGGTLRWAGGNTADISSRTVFIDAGGATLNTNGNNVMLANAIGNGGAGGLIKTGGGTLAFGGDNTFTGTTTVSAGTLQIGAGGTTGSVLGNIVNNAAVAFFRSDEVTYAGTISGTGSVQHHGPGALLTFTGDHTYTGVTTLNNSSILQLGDGDDTGSVAGDISTGTGMLIFNRVDDLTYGGAISGNGTVTKQGDGILRLSGNNTYTGTNLDAGTLELGSAGAIGTTGTISFGGGTLGFSAANTTDYSSRFSAAAGQEYRLFVDDVSVTLATGLTSAGGTLNVSGVGALVLTGTNTFSGLTSVTGTDLRIGSGGATGSLAGDIALDSSAFLTFNRADTYTYAGAISGAGQVRSFGVGTVILTGPLTYTNQTSVVNGSLQFGAGGTLALATSGVALNGAAVIFNHSNALTFAGNINDLSGDPSSMTKAGVGTLTLTGAIDLQNGIVVSAGTLRIGDGGTTGSVAGNIVNNAALVFQRANDLTFGGAISGTGTLTKLGAGKLTLSGANTYSGGTTISAGTLRLGSSGAIGASGTITFGGGFLEFSASNSADYSSRFSTAASQNFRIDLGGQNVTFAAGLTNTGGTLFLTGTGSLTLTGGNTYSGLTTIDNADLRIGSGGTVGSVAGSILNNAFLSFNRSDSLTHTGTISGSGTVRQNGSGTLILTAANTFGGGTDVNAGTLLANNISGSATGSGAVSVQSGATFGGDGAISGAVTVNSGGFLAPGSSPGDLTVGSVTFNAGSTFLIELGGLTPGTEYDRLHVTGTANLNGTLDVSLYGGFVPTVGDTFTILTAGNRVGTFATLNNYGIGYDITYGANDVVLTVTAIPEPATMVLFGLTSLGGAGAWWWRRQRLVVEEATRPPE
ncbi:MAG TPA: autotransporter-associated beta strand repeat-containing protein [Gemmatales bacterium]|nr:autotransporter-associated beta strand repeat-containing protein [Gemmatales bacterium]